MKKHLLSLSIALLPGLAMACSCSSITTFCERVTPESEVISVKILTGYEEDFTHYIDVIFIENVQGDTTYDLLTLRTGSGTSCDPFPEMFVGGDTLVFIVGPRMLNSPSPYATFLLDFACGSNFLIVQDGKVTVGPYDNQQAVSYTAFLDDFANCEASEPPVDEGPSLRVYPSPSTTQVFFDNTHPVSFYFRVYAMTGQIIWQAVVPGDTREPVDVSDWPAGVYFVRFRLGGEEQVERFVVH